MSTNTATDFPAGLMFDAAPEVPSTFNVLLYGAAKSGKSTGAATAPGPIMWINAEGPGALGYARKVAAESGTQIHTVSVVARQDTRQVLRDVISHVRSGAEPQVRTVVVDTVAKVREALIGQIVVPGAKNSIQQFGEVAKILREFVRTLRDEPINLILLCHQDIADADGDRVVRPLIGGALTEEIPGEVDVIAYTHSFMDDTTEQRRYVGQLVESKGRIAGDRSGSLGSFRDLDLSHWLIDYRAALTPGDVPWDTDGAGAEVEQPEQSDDEPTLEPAAEAAPEPHRVDNRVISEAQAKRLWAIARTSGASQDDVKRVIQEVAGVERTEVITRAKYDAVIEALQVKS